MGWPVGLETILQLLSLPLAKYDIGGYKKLLRGQSPVIKDFIHYLDGGRAFVNILVKKKMPTTEGLLLESPSLSF